MSSKPPDSRLKQLVKLSERKDALLAEIQDIDRDMVRLEQEFRQRRRRTTATGKLTVSNETRGRRKSPRRRSRSGASG